MEKKTYLAVETDTRFRVNGGSEEQLAGIFTLLEEKGFAIQTDQKMLEDYPALANTHWEGLKDDLKLKASVFPAGWELTFYQDVNTKHASGGYYDFNRYEMMPYLVRGSFILTRKAICERLDAEGFVNTAPPAFKSAFDEVMYRIKDSCHYEEGKELPGYVLPEYNATDRDGKTLTNGQVKYFRDRKGRLARGTVYHNINNMWWVILSATNFTNISAHNFFDLTEGDLKQRRIQNHVMPQRIRGEKLREAFNAKGLTYKALTETDIQALRDILEAELQTVGGDMGMTLSKEKKKDVKVSEKKGLKHAVIKVSSPYFKRREAITFNDSGFIGFAGWAADGNVRPFLNAFEKWLDTNFEKGS